MELSKENQIWLRWVNKKSGLPKQLMINISANKIRVVLYGMDGGRAAVLSKGLSNNSLNEAIDKCKMTFAENNLLKHIFGDKALNQKS